MSRMNWQRLQLYQLVHVIRSPHLDDSLEGEWGDSVDGCDGGAAVPPFSDEVSVIIVFVRVDAKVVQAFSRSGYRNKLYGGSIVRVCCSAFFSHRLSLFRVYDERVLHY